MRVSLALEFYPIWVLHCLRRTTKKLCREFICQLYQSKTAEELRWSLLKKRQAESDKLPPTKAALHQAILIAHYLLMVWNNDNVENPVFRYLEVTVGQLEDDEWIPVMTTLLPAPKAIIQLFKCKCASSGARTIAADVKRQGLPCMDVCSCSDDDECGNQQGEDDGDDSDVEDGPIDN